MTSDIPVVPRTTPLSQREKIDEIFKYHAPSPDQCVAYEKLRSSGRDLAVAGLREGLSNAGKTLPVNSLGRWKAAAEMAGVGAFLAYQGAALLLIPANVVLGLYWASHLLLWAAAIAALISGAVYAYAAAKRA